MGSIVFMFFLILRFFPLKSERIRFIFLVIFIVITIAILPISFLLFISISICLSTFSINIVDDTILIDSQVQASQNVSEIHEAKTDALKYFKNALGVFVSKLIIA